MKRRILLSALALAGVLAAGAAAAAQAAAPGQGRLERIRDTGVMTISYAEATKPFSYVLDGGPLGFGVDISKRVAEAVRVHLGLPQLRIRWNPVTPSTRFMMVTTGTVDLECVTTTHTRARERMVGFSYTFLLSDEGIATRRDSGIRDYADLAGKRVAVVRGTTNERALLARGLGVQLVPEGTHRRSIIALSEGRADAYVTDAAIIAGEMLHLEDARPFHIVGSGGMRAALACMLPKDEPAYKAVVDAALASMMTSGEMERLYERWFNAPIPPFGRTVGLPLGEANRALYRAPEDRPYE